VPRGANKTGAALLSGAINIKEPQMLDQNKVDIKMISLFQLTKLDGLKASLSQRGQIDFSFVHRGERKPLMSMPVLLFEQLEPIEIRGSIERCLMRYYEINGKKLRVNTSGWTKDPFSSQN
tara:strand:+ start:95 stop:457 length:363 start_codon:yes stop_codon:yes gene_type:complete